MIRDSSKSFEELFELDVVCLGLAADVDVNPAGPESVVWDAFAFSGFCIWGIFISKTIVCVPNAPFVLLVSNFFLST